MARPEFNAEDAEVAQKTQKVSYLRIAELKVGLLVNFHGFPVVKHVHRVVNKL